MYKKQINNYKFIKRVFDLIFAIFLLIVFSPLILVVFFLLIITFKNNVLFFQERPGYKNKIFKIIKFKSMHTLFDENGKLLDDLERTPRIGKLIRSLSIDELPQLINIIKGDMSFIGPRPLRKEYLKKYTKEQLQRHNVRPGITGLAQISGRNKLKWEEKFNLDIKYVNNYSFLMDLSIFIKTIFVISSRRDVKYVYKNGKQEFFSEIE